MIKDQKKVKVGRIPLELEDDPKQVYLKRYNAFSWRYRLVSLLITSAALRSWSGARVLTAAGFHTGKPLAAVEFRSFGMLTKSFFVTEEIPSGSTINLHWQECLRELEGVQGVRRRRTFVMALAELFRTLHQAGVYHNDLKEANIFVCREEPITKESFFLLDLEGIRRFRRLGIRRRIKNLVQLNRSLGGLIRNPVKFYFLKVYLGPMGIDRNIKRAWIKRIIKVSKQADRRSVNQF
ncbi:MAG: hypothetical protein GTO40_26445 [Deltaproteobacteria bacterium]|nr:hypothetical protein [Deltaproteobacteria bacterium]